MLSASPAEEGFLAAEADVPRRAALALRDTLRACCGPLSRELEDKVSSPGGIRTRGLMAENHVS